MERDAEIGGAPPGDILKRLVLIKHRLMLSAAAAALLAAALAAAARADTEISTATSTALSTSTSGSITIDATGSVGIQTSGTPAVTINSNNALTNNGSIANTNVDNGIGVSIDTSGGNINAGTAGFSSTGSINLGGNGTGKLGIIFQGGNTFYGPVTLTTLTALNTLTGSTTAASTSSLIVQGDSSAAFELVQGTKITSNILLGGGGIVQDSSVNSTASNSAMVDLNGTLNGNFYISSALSGVGAGMTGVQTLGGIHSCASDTGAPSGFVCPTSSGGSFVNAGSISLIGTATPNSRGGNPEAGSAVIIGGNIDGGFLNAGPGTSSTAGASIISSSGLVVSGSSAPVVIIDPTKSITSSATTPRGPIIIGPVTADIDPIDPGYSFTNRGSIHGQTIDTDLSSAAMIIQGASSTYFTCLGTQVSQTTCFTAPNTVSENVTTTINSTPTTTTQLVTNVGGLLNTGTISANAVTGSQTVTTNGITSATALYIGCVRQRAAPGRHIRGRELLRQHAGQHQRRGVGPGPGQRLWRDPGHQFPGARDHRGQECQHRRRRRHQHGFAHRQHCQRHFAVQPGVGSHRRSGRQPGDRQQRGHHPGHQHHADARYRRGDQLHRDGD